MHAANRPGHMRFLSSIAATTLLLCVPVVALAQGRAEPAAAIDGGPRVLRPALDPYTPLGVRKGSFVVFSSLETSLRGTRHSGTGGGDDGVAVIVAPEVVARSDWSRHAMTLALRGAYETFVDGDAPDDISASGDVIGNGNIDPNLFQYEHALRVLGGASGIKQISCGPFGAIKPSVAKRKDLVAFEADGGLCAFAKNNCDSLANPTTGRQIFMYNPGPGTISQLTACPGV